MNQSDQDKNGLAYSLGAFLVCSGWFNLNRKGSRIADNRSGFEMGPGGIKVGAIVETTLPSLTDTGKKLKAKIDADPNFRSQLEKWLQAENPSLTVTSFQDSANYEELRSKAVQHFNI